MDNNVQERIDDFLDEVFEPYEDCPTVAELRIEVRHDLLERLDDLIEQGVGEEVAYAQVIAMVGDLRATVEEFAEKDRAYDEGRIGGFTPLSGTQDPQPSPEPKPQEPTGSADHIPTGEAPGETYTGSKPRSGRTSSSEDWASGVAEAMAAGLDSVISQVSSAFAKVEEALGDAGVVAVFSDENLSARIQDWQKRWKNADSRLTFAASDLRGGDFTGQDLTNSTFVAADLRKSDFSGVDLTGSSFKAADLRGAVFNQANLTRANLSTCSLPEAQFARANLTDAVLSHSDMRRIEFLGCTFAGVRAKYADFRNSRFSDCRISNSDFTGADLRKASFDGLCLEDVNFSMANLTQTSFRGSTLRNVNFRNVPRKVAAAIIFEDTTMDQNSYNSLRARGCIPQSVRVES